MGAKSGGKIAGYRYHVGMHLALCLGPIDKIVKILINDRVAWSGESTGGTIDIYKPNLFGGDEREGGVYGKVDVEMGAPSQDVNGYLSGVLSGSVPAFRGICALVLRRFYVGNNSYIKPWSVKAVRTQIDVRGEPVWYQSKADINDGDMNPAHIVYEAITSKEWGMGYPASAIDEANFIEVADTLYTEGFGFSMQWLQQETVEDFLRNIMNHVSGLVYVSPTTGKFKMKLIRNDYDADSLTLFDESNIVSIESYERRAWGETINEINLVYRDRDDNKDKTVTVQDIANIQFQAGVVSQTLQMPGISNATLAERVAFRELLTVSSPLAKCSFVVNRHAWNVEIYSVFKLSFAKYGIGSQIYRVMSIDSGNLTDGKIRITAVEDVFSMPSATYLVPQASGWTDPLAEPVDLTRQRIVEANYWDIHTRVCAADINAFTADFAFLVSFGSREAGVSYGYRLMSKISTNPYQSRGTFQICPSANVDDALIQEVTTTFSFSAGRDVRLVELQTYAYIEDEIVEVVSIDDDASTCTVNRGVLDTVPVAHDADVKIYFAEFWQGRDETEYTEGDVVNAKLLEVTGLGVLPIDDATEQTLTMVNRYIRPYAPGNFKINGLRYPVSSSGDLVLTWSHRDRTLQTAWLVDQTEGNIGPEDGASYTVLVYDNTIDTLVHTESGLAGTTWTYTQAARITDFGGSGPHQVRFELKSVNGGYDSYQSHVNVLDVSDV